LSSRAQAAAAPIVPMVPVACQAPPPLWLGIGAAQPRGDLEADDERRQRLGRRRAGAFGERQQRRNDRRDQLALHVGEVEVERVRGATPFASAASCGEERSDWPTIETAGLAPSARTSSSTIAAGSLRLPASITPTVSMNAVRARSTASAGASLRSKPAMKATSARRRLGAGGIGCLRCLRRLRARRARCAEQRHGARPEEKSAIHVVALHLVAPPGFFRLFGHRANSKDV
jgi:hypothetical protein